jgi:hypothetical protein
MKLTTARFKKLIKEELESVIREENMSEDLKGAIAELKNLMSRGTDGSKKRDYPKTMKAAFDAVTSHKDSSTESLDAVGKALGMPDTDMSMLLINSIMNFAADGRDDAEAAMLVTQGIKPKLHNLIDDIAQEMNPGMLSKIGSKIGSFFSEE